MRATAVAVLTLILPLAARPEEPVAEAKAERVPVLVELFTSEGCSSCPPADAVLQRLLRTQPVPGALLVGLGEHVDYWNYIGWRDPYSAALFTERQEAYQPVFGRNHVYTPQVVVDGRLEALGSDEGAVRAAVEAAAKEAAGKLALQARAEAGGVALHLDAALLPVHADAQVLFALVEDGVVSEVVRGENAGRTLQHAAVVRTLQVAGAAEGAAFSRELTLQLAPGWKRSALRAVAFVQERSSRRVLAAAMAPVP